MKRINFDINVTISDKTCSIHNVPLVSYGKLKPFCIECTKEKTEQEKDDQIERFKKKQINGYLKAVSLVDRKKTFNYTFDNFDASTPELVAYKSKAIDIAKEYAANPKKEFNSIFFGKAGTGKTHLAMAVLNYVNENTNQKTLFLSIPKLLDENRNWVGDKANNKWSKKFTTSRVSEADLVVIDDLGAESASGNATDFVQGVLFDVYEANQRIITTTNLSSSRIRNTYDNRMLSRIEENAIGHVLDFSTLKDRRVVRS